MKRKYIIAAALLGMSMGATAQGYVFKNDVIVPVTSVKNQAASGTCWCFATCSFLEAELMRNGKGEHDLSEMFIVRQKLLNQLNDNFLRRGKGNIGQGSLSHTFLNAFRQAGIVPESVYSGINYDSDRHNHGEMMSMLTAVADAAVRNKKRSPQYDAIVNAILDTYLGKVPEKFTYNGKEYTPASFAESLGFNPDDYVELTSFTHHPYYKAFELEVPDNWEHASQYNLPLDELMQVMDYALDNGYTVCWDGDVSEKGFSHANGVAINPEVADLSRYQKKDSTTFAAKKEAERLEVVYKFEKPYPEVIVTPESRQQGYETFTTTDDHLMHITGRVKDQNGTSYYRTKNSWGTERNDNGGYLNMSDSYVRAKTIYIMVHKDAIPAATRKKLKI